MNPASPCTPDYTSGRPGRALPDDTGCSVLSEDLANPIYIALAERFYILAVINGQVGLTIELIAGDGCARNGHENFITNDIQALPSFCPDVMPVIRWPSRTSSGNGWPNISCILGL